MRLFGESDEEQVALPVRGQGSHMLGGMAAADAILQCPAEADFIAKGTLVDVERIRWSMI
jgi:molybdopterin biosynthesis enzyme